jgi:hypothetical protein
MRMLLSLLLLSSLAHAGSKPTGASCDKSNECVSKRCFERVCRPDSAHPGGLGALCEGDTHCVSKHCAGHKCAAPQESRGSGGSKGKGGAREQVAEDSAAEPVSAPVSAPAEAPLPEPTPCSEDLMKTIYKDKAKVRAYLFYAADHCRFPPESIARARELFAAGYGRNFGATLNTAHRATPEQLACAKKEYDKKRDDKSPRDFHVPSLCLQPRELIACAQDLAAAVFKGDVGDGKLECERRSPAVIATAKEMFLAGFGDSFSNICDILESATPEQIDCSKRDYEFKTAGRTKEAGYNLSGACSRDPAVMHCYFELLGAEPPERQYEDRVRSNIEGVCLSATVEQVALARSLRALGYTQGMFWITRAIQQAGPEQRACLEHLKASAVTQAEKTDSSFRMPRACAK